MRDSHGLVDPPAWVTAGELAEYTYCPRALAYRRREDPSVGDPETGRRAAEGLSLHGTHLRATVRRDRRARWIALTLAVASFALAGVLVSVAVG